MLTIANHQYARQIINNNHFKIFQGDKLILTPPDDPLDVDEYDPKIRYNNDLIPEDDPDRLYRINNYLLLNELGFMVVRKEVDDNKRWLKQQLYRFELARYRKDSDDDYRQFPIYSSGKQKVKHWVEYDKIKERGRLCGPSTTIYGKERWVYAKTPRTYKMSDEQIQNDPMEYINRQLKKAGEIEDTRELIIKDIPIMITDTGELLCLPVGQSDVGHTFATGATGKGKTYWIHVLTQGLKYHTDDFIYVLNDSVMQTLTWSMTNNSLYDKKKLSHFNMPTRPLEMVYLTPIIKDETNLYLQDEGVNYNISLPFLDILPEFDDIFKGVDEFQMGNSYKYLQNNMHQIEQVKTSKEIMDILQHMRGLEEIPKSSYNKLRAMFQTLIKLNIFDNFSGVPAKWRFKQEDSEQELHPHIGLNLAGVIPSIITDDLKKYPKIYPQYMGWLIKTIKDFQSDMKKKSIRVKSHVIIDEMTDIYMTGKTRTIASDLLEEMTLKGRNTEIELAATIQSFTDIDKSIKAQISYLFCFGQSKDEEIKQLASFMGLPKSYHEDIKSLRKLECFAWCRNDVPFVLYSPYSGRRVVYGQDMKIPFKGKLIPTMSLHRKPDFIEKEHERSNKDLEKD